MRLGRTSRRLTLIAHGFLFVSKNHLSSSLLSLSELLLGETARQPVSCLCNGILLSTAVFSGGGLVLDSGLLRGTLACWRSAASPTSPAVAELLSVHGGSACSVQTQPVWSAGRGGAKWHSPLCQGSRAVSRGL